MSTARRAVIDSYRYAVARPRGSDAADWQSAVGRPLPAAGNERAQPRDLPGLDDGMALLDLLGESHSGAAVRHAAAGREPFNGRR